MEISVQGDPKKTSTFYTSDETYLDETSSSPSSPVTTPRLHPSFETRETSSRAIIYTSWSEYDEDANDNPPSIINVLRGYEIIRREKSTSPRSLEETISKNERLIREYGSIWNYKFQKWHSSTNEYIKWIKLQKLAVDFATAAEAYGKIIISEFDPNLYQFGSFSGSNAEARIQKLTIRPVKLGGVAGGVKFLHNGILFKFALDWAKIYSGSDELAMKSAKLEMKGIRCLEWANVPGLCYPLFAVIQLNGYSLIAQSVLPISKETLVYGSVDGGATFKCLDPLAHNMVLKLGEKLNLMKVSVRDSSGQIVDHCGPVDIEIHRGRDGRYYAIDVARLMPAESNAKPMNIFAHCLRPSFVNTCNVPLCSDIFSAFTNKYVNFKKQDTYSSHVSAVSRLKNITKPILLSLNNQPPWLFHDTPNFPGIKNIEVILSNIHKSGFNYRHFGIIVQAVETALSSSHGVTESEQSVLTSLRDNLIHEGVARTLKNLGRYSISLKSESESFSLSLASPAFDSPPVHPILYFHRQLFVFVSLVREDFIFKAWEQLRQTAKNPDFPSSTILTANAHKFLKDFFWAPPEVSKFAWSRLYRETQMRFPHLLDHIKESELEALLNRLSWQKFLSRFCLLSGIQLSERMLAKTSNKERFFEIDVVKIRCRTTMMSVLEVATAKSLLTRANYASRNTFHKDNEILKMNLDLSEATVITLQKHFLSAPLISEDIIKNLNFARGRNYFFTGRIYDDFLQSDYAEALKWFNKAVQLNEPSSMVDIGRMYEEGRGVEQSGETALEWYLRAAKFNNRYAQCHLGVIHERGVDGKVDLPEALKWYELSVAKSNGLAQNRLGLIYLLGKGVEKNLNRAIELLKLAADQNIIDAQNTLGILFEKGYGVDMNKKEAIRYYRAAAIEGSWAAQANLGSLLIALSEDSPSFQEESEYWLEQSKTRSAAFEALSRAYLFGNLVAARSQEYL